MTWRPQLNTVCGRCGKPRSLRHDCVSNSTRKATIKLRAGFGTCPNCGKQRGNPLTHTCHTKTDFKARKARYAQQQRAAKSGKPAHDYQACSDNACPRPLCVAFKTGYADGNRTGYETGWQQGHDRGYAEGQAACPRPHQ